MSLNVFGKIVAEEWERSVIIRQNIQLDTWVVMPNHFHAIVVITDTIVGLQYMDTVVGAQCIAPLQMMPLNSERLHRKPQSLGSFVAGFKMAVTKRINAIRETAGIPVWQRNYHDHIIRNEDALHRIRQYIANNPISWELDKLHPENLTKR